METIILTKIHNYIYFLIFVIIALGGNLNYIKADIDLIGEKTILEKIILPGVEFHNTKLDDVCAWLYKEIQKTKYKNQLTIVYYKSENEVNNRLTVTIGSTSLLHYIGIIRIVGDTPICYIKELNTLVIGDNPLERTLPGHPVIIERFNHKNGQYYYFGGWQKQDGK